MSRVAQNTEAQFPSKETQGHKEIGVDRGSGFKVEFGVSGLPIEGVLV